MSVETVAIHAIPMMTEAAIETMVRSDMTNSSLRLLGLIIMPSTVTLAILASAGPELVVNIAHIGKVK